MEAMETDGGTIAEYNKREISSSSQEPTANLVKTINFLISIHPKSRLNFHHYLFPLSITIMKVFSWNVQGYGNRNTRTQLKDFIRSNDPDIIFLCETKTHFRKMKNYIRPLNSPNYRIINPIGLAGGLCLLWKDGLELEVVNETPQIINCVLKIDARTDKILLSCMYGLLNNDDRKVQWNFIQNTKNNFNCPWMLLGDLNFILDSSEKVGGQSVDQNQIDFAKNLVECAGLQEVAFSGNPFTWSNWRKGNSIIIERLDRALGNSMWFDLYPNCHMFNLAPIASDHSPILVTTSRENNPTKKPSKFNKCWLRDPGCRDIVERYWFCNSPGSHAFKHKKSLQNVKHELRLWNIHSFGNIQTKLRDINSQLGNLHSQGVIDQHDNRNIILKQELDHWSNIQHDLWSQRAKDENFKFNDRNITYFHARDNYRKKRTQIEVLQDANGTWHTDRKQIADILFEHFSGMSSSTDPVINVDFMNNIPKCITDTDNEMLLIIPFAEEIKRTVFMMKPWTSPGPDGFPSGFYQQFCDVVGEDTIRMVQAFFHSKYLLKETNHNFLSLIPKVVCPTNASDFRPISLCNTSYKIISKIIATRLKPILNKIISPFQSAFLQHRTMTDNIVIAHEIVDTMKNVSLQKVF